MDEAAFWDVIDCARHGPGDELARVRAALEDMPAERVAAFGNLLWSAVKRAHTGPLWGAAYVMCGGCSDENSL